MSDIPTPPFAGETAETVLERMLDAVDDGFIKVEGDVIYDMLAPAALEIEKVYQELETYMGEVFPATASGAYLDALALQLTGLTRLTDETDESFRTKVLAALVTPSGAGTEADYRRWLADVAGLGKMQVKNTGTNEVTVYGLATDHTAAAVGVVADMQAALDASSPITVDAIAATTTIAISGAFQLTLTSATAAEIATWEPLIETYLDDLIPGEDFNVYALMGYAAIPTARYDSLDFNGTTTDTIAVADGSALKATSVEVTV